MADIKISKTHTVDIEKLRKRLETLTTELKQKYGVNYTWSGNNCTLSGSGLKKGSLSLTDSTVNIEITLGFLAKALKSTINEQINSKLDEAIG